MQGYKTPSKKKDQGATTNKGNHQRIRELCECGKKLEIWSWADAWAEDKDARHYGEFRVNLAAGLEDDLIEQIKPPWNGKGSKT